MDDGHAAANGGWLWRADRDFETREEAFGTARHWVDTRCGGEGEQLSSIGDFVIPPPGGNRSRDFQTLHFDFGLPLDPRVEQDVALYTALYISTTAVRVSAVTRLVPLAPLLSQRDWPGRAELLGRLLAYGVSHGAWDDTRGYVEGSLARIVEAAAASSPLLPSVKSTPDFLCGMEFDSLRAELAFFERHGLRIDDVAIDIDLRPGQLLVFDNLQLAHGRRGTRQPGELHQRVFGHRRLSPIAQLRLRERMLIAFGASSVEDRLD